MAAVAARAGGLAGWAERSALRRAGSLIAGGPVPGRLRFVFYGRVSTGTDWLTRATPEQGARGVGAAGAPAGARPTDGAAGGVDLRAAPRRARYGPNRPRSTTLRFRARRPQTRSATRIAAATRGRCTPCGPFWVTRVTPGGRCGTGSAPTVTWSTRRTPGRGTGRCSDGTCPRLGHLLAPRPPRDRQRGRFHRCPGPSRPARAGQPGGTTLPAGRAAALRHLRAAPGIVLVQRQARLSVPPRPRHRHPPQTLPGRGTPTSARTRSCPASRPWASASAPRTPVARRRA
jgi:hypothetical protein